MRWTILGVLLSLAVHVGLGVSISAIPKDLVRKHSLVAVVDKKKKKDDKKEPLKDEPPPPPPRKEPPRPAPKPVAVPENTPPPPANTPPPSAAAHPQLAALPNLGISMAGGPGGGGIAVPLPQAAGPADAPRTVEGPAPKPKPKDDDCTEADVKPKSVPIAREGIMAASQAMGGIEGRLRLELQLDASGNVTSVQVMSGLGGAIDAAAVAAAKRAKVSPITRCGRPVAGRLVWAMTLRNQE